MAKANQDNATALVMISNEQFAKLLTWMMAFVTQRNNDKLLAVPNLLQKQIMENILNN